MTQDTMVATRKIKCPPSGAQNATDTVSHTQLPAALKILEGRVRTYTRYLASTVASSTAHNSAAAEIAQQEPVLHPQKRKAAQKKHGWQYLNKRGEVGESGLRIDEWGWRVATKPARRVERVDAKQLVN